MDTSSVENLIALAKQHFRSGRADETESLCQQILSKNPENSEALHLLGLSAHQSGRHAEAEALIRRAIAANPAAANYHSNLGNVLTSLYRADEAIPLFQQAIALNPNMAETYNNLATALAKKDRLDEAAAACRTAISLNPDYASAHYNLSNALFRLGRVDEAAAHTRRVLEIDPSESATHSSLISLMNYTAATAEERRTEILAWEDRHARPLRSHILPHRNNRDPLRRLRVGYISADFTLHASACFLKPLLSNHDHSQFEITCYSQVARPDATTEMFASYADRWRTTVPFSDEQMAHQIRHDEIDILVDLKLHSTENRLLVLVQKPAPIQVSWLGYPGSSGLKTIDYRLTDRFLEPPGSENPYPDQPYYLPNCFWCYDPLLQEPAVNSLPASSSGHVTFGCLNAFYKLNDSTLDLWTPVLRNLPDSSLLVLAPPGSARPWLLEKLARRGIDSRRVDFVSRHDRGDYFRMYHSVDISLDPFPCGGHTTSLDSLWMGVPVVTRVGPDVMSRAGWTQLNQIGLQELAAFDDAQFVDVATGLARDLPRLAQLRSSLRRRMEQSPLMDAPAFARAVEAAFRRMWQHFCQNPNVPLRPANPA